MIACTCESRLQADWSQDPTPSMHFVRGKTKRRRKDHAVEWSLRYKLIAIICFDHFYCVSLSFSLSLSLSLSSLSLSLSLSLSKCVKVWNRRVPAKGTHTRKWDEYEPGL